MNHVRVPERLHLVNLHEQFPASARSVSIHWKNEAHFDGMACTLRDILSFWRSGCYETMAMLAEDYTAPSGLKERCAYFKDRFPSTRI